MSQSSATAILQRAQQFLGLSCCLLLLACSSSPQADLRPAPPVQAAQPPQSPMAQNLPITAKATYNDQVIELEVAQTPAQQERGLMGRSPLPDNRGMLFPFEPPRPFTFWMKNTPSPLDMLFLLDGEIKAIAQDARPCESDPCPTYSSGETVNQVIELRSGRAAELGLKVGDRLTIEFLEPGQPSP
jgi:uncharacterized protein